MKKRVLNILTIIAFALVIVGCKKGSEATITEAKDVTNVEAEAKYKAIPDESMIIWKANKIVGGHEGTIKVSTGIAKTKGNSLVGGNFIFDINSITATDIKDAGQVAKLEKHLKNEDFFEVEKYPNASFEITSVEGNKLSGNLMMKGVKKNITVPAKVEIKDDYMTISSDVFTIDRTDWNIKYNSGKFADAAKLGDYLIKDDVELIISVKAKKV